MFGEKGPSFFELMEQAWSGTAKGYDMLAPKFEATPFCTPPAVVERALGDLGSVADAVDLCCGTGVALEPLAKLAAKRVTGVDFSRGMLDEARKKVAHLGRVPEIELVEHDVLSFERTAAFDLATCFGALGHITHDDEPRFLEVVRKLLRPGGRFVFVTTDHPKPWSRQKLVGELFNTAMHVRNAIKKPPFIMYYLTFLLPDIERHLKWHGFDVTVTRELFSPPYASLARVVATRR